MAKPRSPHTQAWKDRLYRALGREPQTTSALVRFTAVPAGTARKLLTELVAEGLAHKTTMTRVQPGGSPPDGWRLAGDPMRIAA